MHYHHYPVKPVGQCTHRYKTLWPVTASIPTIKTCTMFSTAHDITALLEPCTPFQFPQSGLFSQLQLCSALCSKHGSAAPGTTSASAAASQLVWGWDQQLSEELWPPSWEERGQAVWILRKPLYIFTWQGGSAEAGKQMKHVLHPVTSSEKEKTPCQMKRQWKFALTLFRCILMQCTTHFRSETLCWRTSSSANETKSLEDIF